MRYEPFLVKITIKGKQYSDYGHDRETPIECAKRIVFEKTGQYPEFVQGDDIGERVVVSTIPQDIKAEWPKGALTIPVYLFTSLN